PISPRRPEHLGQVLVERVGEVKHVARVDVDGRPVHGGQHGIGDVRGSGNIEELAAIGDAHWALVSLWGGTMGTTTILPGGRDEVNSAGTLDTSRPGPQYLASRHGGAIVPPFGGNDWLALTPEPAIEPEMPICDPHHHFWDFRTGRIPYQRYLLHELAADIHGGHNVRTTVFIEARAMYRADGPEEMRPVGEVEFVQGLAAASASGLYGSGRAAAAIVGHANLNLGARVAPVLEALQAASPNRFRGIRHSVTWDPHPEVE